MDVKYYTFKNKGNHNNLLNICKTNNYQKFIKVIKKNVNLDQKDKFGNTPLIISCLYNNYIFAKILLQKGANPSKTNNKNISPLFISITKKNYKLINLLLSFGANTKYLKNTKTNLNEKEIIEIFNKYKQDYINKSVNNSEKKINYTNNKDFLKVINNLNNLDRLKIVNNLKVVKKFNSKNANYSDHVYLLENNIVKKNIFKNYLGFHLFQNEIKSLSILSKFNHFPKLIAYDTKSFSIYMSYCGKEISYLNIPNNWIEQFNEIKFIFKSNKISSGDILKKNICVLNNIIYIIDFGLNNSFCEPIEISIKKLYSILYQIDNQKKIIN